MNNHTYPRISYDDIRPGDTIRGEALNGLGKFDCGPHSSITVEFISTEEKRTDGWHAFGEDTRKWYLIDRPAELPTRLYSMVAPPESENHVYQAYILEPRQRGKKWFYGGNGISEDEVREKLKQGWRAIEGPEW